jgi:hypothetical protein
MTGENAERGEKGTSFIQFSFSLFPQVTDAENQNNYLSSTSTLLSVTAR